MSAAIPVRVCELFVAEHARSNREEKKRQLTKHMFTLKYVPGIITGKPLNQKKTFQLVKEKENMKSNIMKENLTVTGKPKDPG